MKKIFLITFLFLITHSIFSQSYLLKWNSTNSNYEIKQVNLSTNIISTIGSSSTMTNEYVISEIYFDKTNNQIIGLYQNTDLWKYSLTTNTDQIIDLGTDTYKELIVADNKSFLIKWNSTNSNYNLIQLNLSDNSISNIGESLTMSSQYDISEMYFDKVNNQIVGLYQNADLWKYDLTTITDQIIDLGTDTYKSLTVSDNKSYLIKWNSTDSNYELKELTLSNNNVINIGTSSTFSNQYDLSKIYFDKVNNQIVSFYQFTDLWKYSLTSNTDQIIDLGTDSYKTLTVSTANTVTTGIYNPIDPDNKDEIIKIVDITGIEQKTIEPNKLLILVYKSGATKKIFLSE